MSEVRRADAARTDTVPTEVPRADTSRLVFLGVLTLVLAGYTVLAMRMEWRTPAGQIGPGFFPRIIGLLALALCVVALVRGRRAPAATGDEPGSESHPRTLVTAVLASVGFFVLLLPLGAVPAAVAFLGGMLFFLDRLRWKVNVAVAVGLPVALYLLFEVLLESNLPRGVF